MFMTPGDWKNHANREGAPPARSYAVLRDAVVEAMDQGFFRKDDVDLVSQVLWAGIHGVVALLITFKPDQFPEAPPHPGLVEASVEATLQGLLADGKETVQ